MCTCELAEWSSDAYCWCIFAVPAMLLSPPRNTPRPIDMYWLHVTILHSNYFCRALLFTSLTFDLRGWKSLLGKWRKNYFSVGTASHLYFFEVSSLRSTEENSDFSATFRSNIAPSRTTQNHFFFLGSKLAVKILNIVLEREINWWIVRVPFRQVLLSIDSQNKNKQSG